MNSELFYGVVSCSADFDVRTTVVLAGIEGLCAIEECLYSCVTKIAKESAVQLLNMLDDHDYVMVVNFWGEINVLQSPTKAVNREEIATLINSIQPYQGTVIGTALDKAGELMIDMAYDDKQIMLISDGMSYTLESDTPADVVTKLSLATEEIYKLHMGK